MVCMKERNCFDYDLDFLCETFKEKIAILCFIFFGFVGKH